MFLTNFPCFSLSTFHNLHLMIPIVCLVCDLHQPCEQGPQSCSRKQRNILKSSDLDVGHLCIRLHTDYSMLSAIIFIISVAKKIYCA